MKAKIAKLKSHSTVLMVVIGASLYIGMLVVGLFSQDHGMRVSLQLSSECRRMKIEIEKISAENHDLKMEWNRLTGDLRYIEKLARDELNMVGDREIVFLFNDHDQNLTSSIAE